MISYTTFLNTYEKIAEERERKSSLRRIGERTIDILPWIAGFGMGGVANDVLKQHLNNVKSPALKTMARVAMPLAGGALSYMILPKIQEKFKKDLMGNLSEPKPSPPNSSTKQTP